MSQNSTLSQPTIENDLTNQPVNSTPQFTLDEYEIIYNKDIDLIRAVNTKELFHPSIPYDKYIEEGEALQFTANEYVSRLEEHGFQPTEIPLLHRRAGSARVAQVSFELSAKTANTTKEKWKTAGTTAFTMRDGLIKAFKFACRKAPLHLTIIKEIAEGATIADMINDLYKLGTYGEQISEELQAIKFDFTKLLAAKELSTELAVLKQAAAMEQRSNDDTRIIRDQAVTLLHESVNDIRDCAKYAFEDEPKISILFTSAYGRAQYQKLKKEKVKTTEAIETIVTKENEVDSSAAI